MSNALGSKEYFRTDYITVSTPETSTPTAPSTATATVTASPTATPVSSYSGLHSSLDDGDESNTNTGTGFMLDLKAGINASFTMGKGAIYKVSINPATNIRKLMITVRRDSSVPSSINQPNTDVYEYEFVDLYYADNSDLSGGTFWFKVKKSWITASGYSSNDIVMLHYDEEAGEWEKLKTTYTCEDRTNCYYKADISSFSLFAIAISKGGTIILEEMTPKAMNNTAKGIEKTVKTDVPTSSVIVSPLSVTQINMDSSKRNSSWMSYAMPVILVILGVVIIIGIKKSQKKDGWSFSDWGVPAGNLLLMYGERACPAYSEGRVGMV